MREPTDRERSRASEIARRTVARLSKHPPPPGARSLSDEEVVRTIEEQILEAAIRTYEDDSWTEKGVEPTVNLQFLMDRIRR